MNYALVGAFVLVLGAALIAAALWLASGGAVRKQYDDYLAYLDESVAGLNVDAPVKLKGVDVGKVRKIALDPTNPERVRLQFAIERGTPIKQDTVAVLRTQGLTGIANVELSGGSPGSPPLVATEDQPFPVIQTKPSLTARLETVVTGVLAKLDRTTSNIDAMLSDENRVAVTSALADIAALAQTLAARKGTLDKTIASAGKTFDNAAVVSAQAGPLIARLDRAAKAIETLGDDGALASRRAIQVVDSAGPAVQRLSTETLPEIQRVLAELQGLSNSLRRLSEQTERDPAGLLFGRGAVPPGPGETAVAGAAR